MLRVLVIWGSIGLASAATWCGKNYKSTDPIVPPGGHFPVPANSDTPLLALRCAPAYKPYLASDGKGEILVDALVVRQKINGAKVITGSLDGKLQVTVTIDSKTLATASVSLNSTKAAIPIDFASLKARKDAYAVTCSATYQSQTFSATSSLVYLPDNTAGTVTKYDARTGGLLAKPIGGSGPFAPVFPFGFYTNFDDYLAKDLHIIDILKQQNFTIIHPSPVFTNQTALTQVLDRMAKVGMYLMYDMRWTYMDTNSVTEQVNKIKNHPSLLLWYTADEPDGTSDPRDAVLKSKNLIQGLDGGGYHPVSLVLNCQDYYFTEYAAGGEIVLQDAYMIGNNVTWSEVWHTPCTADYGDCGCDNCKGQFEDISRRMDEYRERLFILGRELESVVWAVPQGFGEETYWKRKPTGKEWVVEALLGINHGAMGVVSWNDPTTTDIKTFASLLATALPSFNPFLFSHTATVYRLVVDRVDICTWTVPGTGVLVIATNLNYRTATVSLKDIGIKSSTGKQVFDSGARLQSASVVLDSVGSGAFVFTS